MVPRATEIQDTSVLILWTVPRISYTPETYSVMFGTESEALTRMSGTVESGSDITDVDIVLSLPLTGLQPETLYYYRLDATNSFFTIENEVDSFTTAARSESPDSHVIVM